MEAYNQQKNISDASLSFKYSHGYVMTTQDNLLFYELKSLQVTS